MAAPPPTAKSWPSLSNGIALRRDPLRFLSRLAHDHGDIVHFPVGGQDMFLLNHPDLIRDVLVTHDRQFAKGRGLQIAERLLGKGLLTSEGEFHRRQRRLAQPAFHRQRIAAYGQVMTDYALQTQERWQEGATVEMAREMRRLTLAIAGKTLFDADVEAETEEIALALTEAMHLYRWATLPFAERLEGLFPTLTRRFERARDRLDATIYRIIGEHRAGGRDRGDLLSMLLLAQDETGEAAGMSDLQIRDEAMTLLLAGHETTANALTWTWYLLSAHPDVEARLHAELDTVLADRTPNIEDVPQLPYTRMVLAEAMRRYPPAWTIARRALEDYPLDSQTVPAGAILLLSPWVMHHDARYYPDPHRFDPERWTPEAQAARPRFAYFPFGGGSRVCIGEQFAWTEMVLVLATLARLWRMRLVPGHRVVPNPCSPCGQSTGCR